MLWLEVFGIRKITRGRVSCVTGLGRISDFLWSSESKTGGHWSSPDTFKAYWMQRMQAGLPGWWLPEPMSQNSVAIERLAVVHLFIFSLSSHWSISHLQDIDQSRKARDPNIYLSGFVQLSLKLIILWDLIYLFVVSSLCIKWGERGSVDTFKAQIEYSGPA